MSAEKWRYTPSHYSKQAYFIKRLGVWDRTSEDKAEVFSEDVSDLTRPLMKKGLIKQVFNQNAFYLTEEGKKIADQIKQTEENIKNAEQIKKRQRAKLYSFVNEEQKLKLKFVVSDNEVLEHEISSIDGIYRSHHLDLTPLFDSDLNNDFKQFVQIIKENGFKLIS